MEHIFDRNDVPTNPTVMPKDDNAEEYDIGKKHEPKFIRLSK
jgi:hypothetical protein